MTTNTISPIGTPQTLHRLGSRQVAVIRGGRATYAYAADAAGEITDWTPLATAPAGSSDDAVLAALLT